MATQNSTTNKSFMSDEELELLLSLSDTELEELKMTRSSFEENKEEIKGMLSLYMKLCATEQNQVRSCMETQNG